MATDRRCCDELGGIKTFQNQVSMPLNGRVQCIDYCIHHIVAALNAGNIRTVGSCCGHGTMDGNIILEDGRTLIIRPTPPEITCALGSSSVWAWSAHPARSLYYPSPERGT